MKDKLRALAGILSVVFGWSAFMHLMEVLGVFNSATQKDFILIGIKAVVACILFATALIDRD